ncbi:MAG: DUF4159 domain-containing protein [Robiginitomaculum sp.]|nr:DUF4159 domain-containing protein [Robiginitomaculum sp.]
MFGSLIFLNPWSLLALLLLPIFWFILSALPPQPVLQKFPPIRYLRDLQDKTASPQKIPWWLRILRLSIVASIILALSTPVILPRNDTIYDRPVLLIIDDGWASATNWSKIQSSAKTIANAADLAEQQIAMAFTSSVQQNQNIAFEPYGQLLERLQNQQVQAFAPNHGLLADILQQSSLTKQQLPMQIIWLSDGNDYGQAKTLLDTLSAMGKLQILYDAEQNDLQITGLEIEPSGLKVGISSDTKTTGVVIAQDKNGNVLSRNSFEIPKNQTSIDVTMPMPLELRNRMTAVRIKGVTSAAAVHLVDSSWAIPRLGIIAGRNQNTDQPLLSERFYLEKALRPFAQISAIDINQAEQQLPPIIVLLDTGKLSDTAYLRLSEYVENGGLLIRFAGPRLAERQDDLIPVSLRSGGRLLGSSLGWEQPQQLSPFAGNSPFFGLDHQQQINVTMQVLADSSPGLSDHVWARLGDGTPLVTSAVRGSGRIVLFHVTAAPNWSQLPLSGIFVAMLKRILPLAANPITDLDNNSNINPVLDLKIAISANGQLTIPDGSHQILPANAKPEPVNAIHPAGLWSNGKFSLARNVLDNLEISDFPQTSKEVIVANMDNTKTIRFAGFLLALALVLLIIDNFLIFILSGKTSTLKRSAKTVIILLAFGLTGNFLFTAKPATAEQFDPFEVIEQTRLAYVTTNNVAIDRLSHAGLKGLSRELYLRTTVEPAEPVAINLETDDLNVILLLYWPLLDEVKLSDAAIIKLNTYLKNGGMLVIDTQDAGFRALSAGGVDPALKSLFSQIDVPALRQVPKDHVLTRAYYLIESFPGRYADAPIWVEADRKGSSLDGVSSLVIGSNDWAAAWAIDKNGQPMAGLAEQMDNQREMANRFGINLVMYVLAGNYKADQVHIPTLLERLQQ